MKHEGNSVMSALGKIIKRFNQGQEDLEIRQHGQKFCLQHY